MYICITVYIYIYTHTTCTILLLQIFSKSMAHGLRFYKNFLPELQNCDSTANFCEWINNLFDALNRNKSSSGVTIEDKDYKVNLI